MHSRAKSSEMGVGENDIEVLEKKKTGIRGCE
jgi:hypothetical protein